MYHSARALCFTAVTICAALAPAPQAQTTRALQIEDYYRIKTVGGARIAPDGGWVLFTVATRLEDDPAAKRVNASTTQTFVVNADGTAAPRLVQHDGKDVIAARWTDDSWVQYRVGTQTFKVRAAGGAAVPVEGPARASRAAEGGDPDTPARGGRGAAPVASPDGRWLAETREKQRPKSEPQYASDFEKRHQERFKGVIFDWKDFQRDGAPFPAPDPTAANALQLVVRPAAGGGDPKVLVDLDIRPGNITWHPDGKSLAFTADATFRDQLKYSKTDLWTVTLDSTVTQLTKDGYVYGDVDFSPDGKYLSYVRSFGTDMIIRQKLNHGGSRDIYIRPVNGGDPVNLTAKWDLDPGDTHWSADGRHLYFTAATGGETHLFRVSAPGGVVEQVTRGPRRIGSLTYDKGMTKIAYTVGLREAPPDVYVANIDGTGERRLSNVHAGTMAGIAFSRAERLQWPSNDGTTIEGFLMLPHGYDPAKGPYPMIVTSHGGPHSAIGYAFNFRDQYFAAHGYFVLDTNFRSSTGYGDAFKWATWGAWGDKDGQDVTSGIDYVLKRYPVDPKRVGHTGHSYGGFMTNWLITQYPDTFAAAIAGAGISNWISDYGTADIYRTKETEFFGPPWDTDARERMIRQSPLTYAGRVKTPTLFVHGEVDQRVPYEEAEQMYFALRRRGVPAKMIRYNGQSHGISGHTNVVHRLINELAWFDKYLKPQPTPGTKN
jgi:dipeptidyl aminopeptidase/acylaminoacyl peptidase